MLISKWIKPAGNLTYLKDKKKKTPIFVFYGAYCWTYGPFS